MAVTPLVGNEVLWVVPVAANGMLSAAQEQITTAQLGALSSSFSNNAPVTVSAVTGTTLTAAQLISGLINRIGPTANFTDTTDTAAAIAAALGTIGYSFYTYIKNGTAFVQTLAGGTGVTFSSSTIVPANSIAKFLVMVTSASAVTFNHVSTVELTSVNQTRYTALTNTAGFTLTAATAEAGVADVTINLTGTLGAGANVQSDTAANIVAAIPNAHAGFSYRMRIINSSGGAFAWTLTTNTGITLAGTMTIAQNTYRDFYVTLTSLTAVTIQAIGTGTQS